MKLTREQAQDMADDIEIPGFRIVTHQPGSRSRWSFHTLLVFQETGKDQLWGAIYSRGATEYQDETPFQYETEVTCFPVEAVPTIQYQKVKESPCGN